MSYVIIEFNLGCGGLTFRIANGNTYTVQVNTQLKIYELIRRIRTRANLAPAATVNPRVVVGGEAVGHLAMVGEAGIDRGSGLAVAFEYDGA